MVSEGYHAIKMDGCEFLIASDNDGRLDLTDIYVQVWHIAVLLVPHMRFILRKYVRRQTA